MGRSSLEKRREQQRKWRAANPEKQAQYALKYRERNISYQKQYREKNREKLRERYLNWVKNNPDRHKANSARARSKERYKSRMKDWKKNHPEKEARRKIKSNLSVSAGIPYRMIPEYLVDAKEAQLRVLREIKSRG